MAPLDNISAPGIRVPAGEPLLYNMRQEVASLLNRKNINFPGAQPVSFARRHLEELARKDYFVCEKSDGMRYLLYLTEDEHGREAQYLIDRKNDYWYIPPDELHFPIQNDRQGFHINTLIDGELVMDKVPGGGMQPKYLVFDCLVLDGNNLMSRTLDKRIAYFRDHIFSPYKKLYEEFPEEKPHLRFLTELKAMNFSYAIQMMFTDVLPRLPHGNDGLIFTCRETEYKHGTDQHILKWKPENENSVDFRLVLDFPLIQPDTIDRAEGITEPYLDYDSLPTCNLHVHAGDGKDDTWYGTMYLEPEQWEMMKAAGEPWNDRIIECWMDERRRWRYMRPRDDKTVANHISTVESVIESITDRVTEKDLIAVAGNIRTQWKRRAAEVDQKEVERKRNTSVSVNAPVNGGAKRKAEEQAAARPSPGPPVRPQ
ncbi:mRNA processing 2 [Hyphodiscus hymeniophilus]|uniref:mRNA-capping enzyme subunit alpha n=1 Tax=Hyphodiscus hymeniophilus TaxID=353542 RepID=A0A9P7AVN6_9HELO|nr:mRNA processing 2 [Hyphodiscus hymeniophilus]